MGSKRQRELAEKRCYWGGHISSWGESGLSHAEYCRRHNLAAHRLHCWVKKLGLTRVRKDARPAAGLDLVEVKWDEAVAESAAPDFDPLRVLIGERFVIEVGGDFDQAVWEKLAAGLNQLC